MICDAYAKANRFSVRIIAKPRILETMKKSL